MFPLARLYQKRLGSGGWDDKGLVMDEGEDSEAGCERTRDRAERRSGRCVPDGDRGRFVTP